MVCTTNLGLIIKIIPLKRRQINIRQFTFKFSDGLCSNNSLLKYVSVNFCVHINECLLIENRHLV